MGIAGQLPRLTLAAKSQRLRWNAVKGGTKIWLFKFLWKVAQSIWMCIVIAVTGSIIYISPLFFLYVFYNVV